jgi:hypothetical protein
LTARNRQKVLGRSAQCVALALSSLLASAAGASEGGAPTIQKPASMVAPAGVAAAEAADANEPRLVPEAGDQGDFASGTDSSLEPLDLELVPTADAGGEPFEIGLRKPAKTAKIPHTGLTLEARVGTLGCTGPVCRGGSAHDASPGVRVDGLVGWNADGLIEIGLTGGWGRPRPNVTAGQNAISLYGVEPADFELALNQVDSRLDLDLGNLAVRETTTTAAHACVGLRLHFLRHGRAIAFIGSGIGYSLFRARYATDGGKVGLDFHGFLLPFEAGLGVHITRHLALVAQGSYLRASYITLVLDLPSDRTVVPIAQLDSADTDSDIDLKRTLPRFWTATVALRARLL